MNNNSSEIVKKYHFYSAHRNENLVDKCKNLHGHTYFLQVVLGFKESDFDKDTGVFVNFGDIDNIIEPIVKELDHATFVSKKDILLLTCINDYRGIFGKVVEMDDTTSVENLCLLIADKIKATDIGKYLKAIKIKETTSSEVVVLL